MITGCKSPTSKLTCAVCPRTPKGVLCNAYREKREARVIIE